jgi:hypothetical protein
MRIFASVILVLAFVSLSGMADARVKIKKACAADLEKFCGNVKKGGGRKACLRTHQAELQPACADALKERDAEKVRNKY